MLGGCGPSPRRAPPHRRAPPVPSSSSSSSSSSLCRLRSPRVYPSAPSPLPEEPMGPPGGCCPPPPGKGGSDFWGWGSPSISPPLQSVPHGADGGAARWVRTPNWAEGSRGGGGGSDFWEGGPPSVSPPSPPLCSSPIGHNLSCVSYKHPSVRGSLVGGEVGAAPSTVRCPPRQCCIGIWNRSQALVQGEPLRGGPRGGCGAEQPLGAAVRGGFASLPAPTSAFGWGCGGAGTDRGGGG